jgi:hypothetical protein
VDDTSKYYTYPKTGEKAKFRRCSSSESTVALGDPEIQLYAAE